MSEQATCDHCNAPTGARVSALYREPLCPDCAESVLAHGQRHVDVPASFAGAIAICARLDRVELAG